ncbi:MAG: hypothetical protein FJ102_21500 [Deltaproteobacteria bacterium]|nr:hypothetical protein [Deltaproteobacteria bacterium]
MVLLSLFACDGCSAETDSSALVCWEPLTCSGECITLDEYRANALGLVDLQEWQESRCGDGRTEVSYMYDITGGTLCFGPDGHIIGAERGSDIDTGDGPCDGPVYYGELCDCNADGRPDEAPEELDEGECYSALDCGANCWTLEEQRAFCAALDEDNEYFFPYGVTDATCADGRVEFLCDLGGNGVRYCFSPEGQLLGAQDGIPRKQACDDDEGELCDCNGDGQPEGAE